MVGSEFDDVLVDSRGDNNLRGEGGDDVLVATDGIDLLVGGVGRDHYVLITARGTKYLDVCDATANVSSSDVIHIPNLPHLYHVTDHGVFRILASNTELSLSFSPAKMWKSVVDFFLLRQGCESSFLNGTKFSSSSKKSAELLELSSLSSVPLYKTFRKI